MGVFPPAGVGEHDVARVRDLARVVAGRLGTGRGPMLRGEPAVAIERWSVISELLAWYCFRGSARAIRALGRLHAGLRAAGVYAFAVFLAALVLVGLPATVLVAWLISPAHGAPPGRLCREARGADRAC